MDERRKHPRRAIKISARVAAAPEQRLPPAEAVDVSRGGLLLAFDEPVGFPVTHRLVISLDLPDGHFHALGHVSRVERGEDFRTYVAMNFVDVGADEFDELLSRLDALDQGRTHCRARDGARSSDRSTVTM